MKVEAEVIGIRVSGDKRIRYVEIQWVDLGEEGNPFPFHNTFSFREPNEFVLGDKVTLEIKSLDSTKVN